MDDLKELGVVTFELDVTSQESIDKAKQIVFGNLGSEALDILINNAGIMLSNSRDDMEVEQSRLEYSCAVQLPESWKAS
jgi:NADP-dependent 3-hydroxy acid dehydrogenase YdfG